MRELLNLAHSLRVEHQESSPMFRAVVFSIALTVAAGPSATLLCGTWCDRPAAAATGCRHEDPATSPTVAAGGSCDSMALSSVAFLREEARRGKSASEAAHAVLVRRYQLAHSTTKPSPHHQPGLWSLEIPPLPTVLRI